MHSWREGTQSLLNEWRKLHARFFYVQMELQLSQPGGRHKISSDNLLVWIIEGMFALDLYRYPPKACGQETSVDNSETWLIGCRIIEILHNVVFIFIHSFIHLQLCAFISYRSFITCQSTHLFIHSFTYSLIFHPFIYSFTLRLSLIHYPSIPLFIHFFTHYLPNHSLIYLFTFHSFIINQPIN